MLVMGNVFGRIEFALTCWKIGVIFLRQHLLNKSSRIIWVVLKWTGR